MSGVPPHKKTTRQRDKTGEEPICHLLNLIWYDNSPNPLKQQLENHLGETGTGILLNDKIDAGEIDIDRIRDMPSLTAFKQRLDEVLVGLSQ